AVAIAYLQGKEKAGIWPVVFVLAAAAGFLLVERLPWRWLPRPGAVRGIFASSILFAAWHSSVWPSPIALFALSLGLGWLAYRTQSLVAPILLHALFNAVTCLVLLVGYFAGDPPENGNAATAAPTRPPSASTSSTVPGSWLPRRTYASAMPVPIRGDTTDDVTFPTSVLSRYTLAPDGTVRFSASRRPTNERFTWP